MQNITIKPSTGAPISFEGERLASVRGGTDFSNTSYDLYRTSSGAFVAVMEFWDGRSSYAARDGTLEIVALVCQTARDVEAFFWDEDLGDVSEAARDAMEQAGLIVTVAA